MKEQFNYLIANISKIAIPGTMVNGVKNGSLKIMLRHKTFNFKYNGRIELSTTPTRIIGINETLSFGTGDNELQWPEDKIPDLLKYLFIFHYMYVAPEFYGLEMGHAYNVYEFKVGKYHPTKTSLRNNALLERINQDIASITDTTIDLNIG